MSIPKRLLVGPVLAIAVSVAGVQVAYAEPLTPLTPAEIQYLDQLHRILRAGLGMPPVSGANPGDPIAFRSDGELLSRGRHACALRDQGFIGEPATLETPAINQLAFIYLCPS